ncbi:uncharacterized protein C2orf42-like [Ostrea edulis]|uniref:uncharacterized protein C2orf42-like n=1 Tax=Ostrea edulis TaxID=37623 RepID=UPI0024AF8319|nr:uncharacterized protein C2orf42-like [Ostrea edulis]XP_048744169.2 uncharacterized protein C2orf42-like [Ostrea edulis]XP_056005812.1 uncharacterized protein C2orf42-like [Ostrea edulis]
MATPDKLKTLFEDLGKPTLRGVRKCPKCGTYNGTRGISCKNKTCDVVFKEREKKKGHSADAVKIITGSTVQVFSVRLRDRGPDYRGFVQLPLFQDMDGNPATVVDQALVYQAARCYVDSCSRNSQLGFQNDSCPHIRAAIECEQEAQPLTLKNSVLNALQVPNDTKQAIWLLATETTGPLVQRVTKNIMVVKCKVSPKQPLGFLHFAFFETTRNRTQPEHKFQCTCRSFKTKPGPKEDLHKRCVHFYACICAFASDEKLQEEFEYYINLDANLTIPTDMPSPERQVVAIFQDNEIDMSDPTTLEVVISDDSIVRPAKKLKKDETMVQASNALLTLQEGGNPNSPKKNSPVKQPPQTKAAASAVKKPGTQPIDESLVVVSFHQWLGSVTERINQTMHYQFDGFPDPLVFHAPQVFFECLQQRISSGSKKKRLPNSIQAFVRKDALPLGTFTKYTWQITNILHVKQIFDTPEMPLDITRNFVENRDGTFDLYEVPKVQVENLDEPFKGKNPLPIRPFELKTYLKVGNTSADQKEPTPFVIEWIPDILPKSRIGELRIKFEYGHQRNGQIVEHRLVTHEIPVQAIHVQDIG